MAGFKPDMSWRDGAKRQGEAKREERPSGQQAGRSEDSSGEHAGESAAERLKRLRSERPSTQTTRSTVDQPTGYASGQAVGTTAQSPAGSATGFKPDWSAGGTSPKDTSQTMSQPAQHPSRQAEEQASQQQAAGIISRLGGPRAVIVGAVVVAIALVAAFTVMGGVGDVTGGGAGQSSSSASATKKKTVKGIVDIDAITDDKLHDALADYDNNDDGKLSAKEAQRITQLSIEGEVTDFAPIAPLDKLDTLQIDTLSAKKVDVSKLEVLEVLRLEDMTTQDLDLSSAPKLNAFRIAGLKGAVNSIKASGLKNLMFFTVDKDTQGDVEKIDLSNDDVLGALEITCNVGELDLSGCSHSFPKLNIAADHIDKIVVDSKTNADLVATLRDLCTQKGWTLEEK